VPWSLWRRSRRSGRSNWNPPCPRATLARPMTTCIAAHRFLRARNCTSSIDSCADPLCSSKRVAPAHEGIIADRMSDRRLAMGSEVSRLLRLLGGVDFQKQGCKYYFHRADRNFARTPDIVLALLAHLSSLITGSCFRIFGKLGRS
jgi:hypothetical protein